MYSSSSSSASAAAAAAAAAGAAPPASGVPPLVSELARAVGRTFLRDEFAVVLDRLSREHLVRSDDLRAVFGLPHRQARAILTELVDEKLVCAEEVVERMRSKRDARLDVETQIAHLKEQMLDPAAAEQKRKRKAKKGRNAIDFGSSEDEDEDDDDEDGEDEDGEDEDGATGGGSSSSSDGGMLAKSSDAKAGAFSRDGKAAAAALAERRKKKKRRRRVKTVCYYVSRRAAPSHPVLCARARAP